MVSVNTENSGLPSKVLSQMPVESNVKGQAWVTKKNALQYFTGKMTSDGLMTCRQGGTPTLTRERLEFFYEDLL